MKETAWESVTPLVSLRPYTPAWSCRRGLGWYCACLPCLAGWLGLWAQSLYTKGS